MKEKNYKYWLENDEVVSRPATKEEIESARDAARKSDISIRSCWNCNPCHERFLNDLNDGFFFNCIVGCGRYYYQGIDITGYSEEDSP